MRIFASVIVFAFFFLWFTAAGADHKIADGATTYIWAACLDLASTDELVEIIVDPNADPENVDVPDNCILVNQRGVDEREHFPIYMGVLVDVQGNHFTVHKVTQESGMSAWLFVYEIAELKATRDNRDS